VDWKKVRPWAEFLGGGGCRSPWNVLLVQADICRGDIDRENFILLGQQRNSISVSTHLLLGFTSISVL
jgi:hypothetical protein